MIRRLRPHLILVSMFARRDGRVTNLAGDGMTFISRGEVYDGYPMGADCDLDALIEWRLRVIEQATNLAFDFCMALIQQFTGLPALNFDFLHELPAAAGLSGAGSPVPVSGASPLLPAPQNETRNE